MCSSEQQLEKFGWTAVPHAQSVLLKDVSPWDPANYSIWEISTPESEIASRVMGYAKEKLPTEVYNHSMRVYYYGKHSVLPLRLSSCAAMKSSCLYSYRCQVLKFQRSRW